MKTSPDHPPADTLWLGVHKTGTTFLQKSLDLSQEQLRAGGVQYLELSEFRRLYTRPLLHPGHPDQLAAPPEAVVGLRQRLIFDENLLSLVQDALGTEGLYPKAGQRARMVAHHFHFSRPAIVLGLRNFRSFLPSLYCEATKSTPFKRFRRFCLTPFAQMSWDDLITRLTAVFPHSEIIIYTAEALRGHEAALLSHVTGLPPQAFTLIAQAERPGFSHQAVMAMHDLNETRPVLREDVRAINKTYPKTPAIAGYDPWTAQEAADLDQRYAEDLAKLVARGNVRFLDPVLRGL